MSETRATDAAEAATAPAPPSPPPAEQPAKVERDPAARLHELAAVLMKTHNRRLLLEYLRLRRAAG